jgi:hypothetical protein
MLREMRQSGELCCIEIYSDFHYLWEVAFARFRPDDHTYESPPVGFQDLNKAIEAAYQLWKGTLASETRRFSSPPHRPGLRPRPGR